MHNSKKRKWPKSHSGKKFEVSYTTPYTFKSPESIEKELLRILETLEKDYEEDYSDSEYQYFDTENSYEYVIKNKYKSTPIYATLKALKYKVQGGKGGIKVK